MPIMYAHKLTCRLAKVRKNNARDFLRPDGKSQVTTEYENGTPVRVDTVMVSTRHKPNVTYDDLKEAIIEEVTKKVVPKEMILSGAKKRALVITRTIKGLLGDNKPVNNENSVIKLNNSLNV